MSASAESLQTENVESDADAVSDSDVSQETLHYSEKGLTFYPEGAPTSGLAFVCKPGSMATRGKTPAPLICGSSGTRSSIRTAAAWRGRGRSEPSGWMCIRV